MFGVLVALFSPGTEHQPVTQDIGGNMFDIVRIDGSSGIQIRVGFGGCHERDGGALGDPGDKVIRMMSGFADLDYVVHNAGGNLYAGNFLLGLKERFA